MDLPRAGREYAHVGWHNLPANPPTPRVHLEGQWWDMAWWDDTEDPEWARQAKLLDITLTAAQAGTQRIARILLAGPAATANPDGTVVITAVRTRTRARLEDITEVLERELDPIDLTGA